MSAAEAKALKPGDELRALRFGKGRVKVVGILADSIGEIVVMRNAGDLSGQAFCLATNQLGAFKKVAC